MTSWRVPGSILEAPGLYFEGFWGRFFDVFDRVWLRFFETVVLRHNANNVKKAKNARAAKNLPKQELDHRRAKSGWAAVHPPRGVSIRRPTLVGNGVLGFGSASSV